MKLPKTCPNCLKELFIFNSDEDLFPPMFICGGCGNKFQLKLVEIDSQQSFIVGLKKYGNSFVLRVPPQIAELYKLDQKVKVTLENV